MSWQNLTQEQLEALPTPRLLNVYKLARQRYFNRSVCDKCAYGGECTSECDESLYCVEAIKSILNTRGHVDTGSVKITPATLDPLLRKGEVSVFSISSGTGKSLRHLAWSEREAIASGEKILTKEGTARPAFGPIKDLEAAVGQQVSKTSGKPFKSKLSYNTVSGVTTNPHTNRKAFTFEEDDSVVDAHICKLRNT